jgi:hypothetical protein
LGFDDSLELVITVNRVLLLGENENIFFILDFGLNFLIFDGFSECF